MYLLIGFYELKSGVHASIDCAPQALYFVAGFQVHLSGAL
jgi:hypothetical protein